MHFLKPPDIYICTFYDNFPTSFALSLLSHFSLPPIGNWSIVLNQQVSATQGQRSQQGQAGQVTSDVIMVLSDEDDQVKEKAKGCMSSRFWKVFLSFYFWIRISGQMENFGSVHSEFVSVFIDSRSMKRKVLCNFK